MARLLSGADLGDGGAVSRIVDEYTRRRKPEAEALQRTSWTIGNITSWSSRPMAVARDRMMRGVAGRKQVAGIEAQFAQAAQFGQ